MNEIEFHYTFKTIRALGKRYGPNVSWSGWLVAIQLQCTVPPLVLRILLHVMLLLLTWAAINMISNSTQLERTVRGNTGGDAHQVKVGRLERGAT